MPLYQLYAPSLYDRQLTIKFNASTSSVVGSSDETSSSETACSNRSDPGGIGVSDDSSVESPVEERVPYMNVVANAKTSDALESQLLSFD